MLFLEVRGGVSWPDEGADDVGGHGDGEDDARGQQERAQASLLYEAIHLGQIMNRV